MSSPVIIVIAIVACSVIAAVIETVVESRRKTEEYTQTLDACNDLADALSKVVSTSFGVSCSEKRSNMIYPYPVMSAPCPINPSTTFAFEQPKPMNCPNCGAPAHGSECEYCGTIFERTSSYEKYNIEVNFAHDADIVARSLRRFNSATGTYEWVAESENKSVSTV